ncbi:DUF4010 domain-containing protein [archaeon]|nr:DUF4010 domain-containing protein [archaeon]
MKLVEQLLQNFELIKILVAFLIGALVGLERTHSKQQDMVGIRTLALIALLACLLGILGPSMNADYLPVIGFIFTGFLATALYIMNLWKFREIGITTIISMLLTYVLGFMASLATGIGDFQTPIFIAVLISIILFTKDRLHQMIWEISHKEMLDLMEFLLIIGIIYPFISETPYEIIPGLLSLDLHSLWLLTVLISVMNLIGFIGSRIISTKKSLAIISLLSGLISQKVSCASLAHAYTKTKNADLVAGSMLMANASLLIRNLILVSLFVPIIVVEKLLIPVIVGFILLAGFGYYKIRKSKKALLKIESPFNVQNAVQLSLKLFVIIIAMELLIKYTQHLLFPTLFIGGVVSGAATLASLAIISKEITMAPLVLVLGFGIITISEMLLGIIPIFWIKKSMPVIPKYAPYAIIATLAFTIAVALICCA